MLHPKAFVNHVHRGKRQHFKEQLVLQDVLRAHRGTVAQQVLPLSVEQLNILLEVVEHV